MIQSKISICVAVENLEISPGERKGGIKIVIHHKYHEGYTLLKNKGNSWGLGET